MINNNDIISFRFVLASASPRRRGLLEEAGYSFEVDPALIVEPEPEEGFDPVEYTARTAWLKARSVAARRPNDPILAADTVCAIDATILGKPVDRADAERMIRLQEGRDLEVLTGLCLYRGVDNMWIGCVETSVVRFALLTDREREAFLDTGRWQGKAGAYGVQDRDPFVSVVSGSFSNVVGLPMERVADLFAEFAECWTAPNRLDRVSPPPPRALS